MNSVSPADYKRNLLLVLLAALAVWPAVHFGLQRRFDINPWKFGGWAMYGDVRKQAFVYVFVFTPDRRSLRFDEQTPKLRYLLERYRAERVNWGRLTSSEALIGEILKVAPKTLRVEIHTDQHRLSGQGGYFAAQPDVYAYERYAADSR